MNCLNRAYQIELKKKGRPRIKNRNPRLICRRPFLYCVETGGLRKVLDMIELSIGNEVEQAEEPKQQENQQPKAGSVPESGLEEEGQRPKATEAAEQIAAEPQAHKTGAAAAAAMIRDAEPRLVRKLIDRALQGDVRAHAYLLDHSRHVDQIKLGNVEIAEDGVENLRKLLNAYSTGKIGGTEAKAVARQLEAFVKAAIALDTKVVLAALERQVNSNERKLIQLMNLLKQKDGKKGG